MKQSMVKGKALVLILVSGTLVWGACSKSSNSNSTSTTSVSNTSAVAQGDAGADAQFDDVTSNVMTTNANGQAIGSVDDSTSSFRQAEALAQRQARMTTFGPDSGNSSVTITVVPDAPDQFPKTVTINFGAGFTDLLGITRSGSVATVFTGPLGTAGASATTTFTNYVVDSVQIAGTHIITNTSASGTISFNVQVKDATVTLPNGFSVTWNSTRTRTMTAGASTPRWPFDDIYSITGSGSGNTSTRISWTSSITSPLVKAYICPWFEQGTVKIQSAFGTGVLDYGAGGCDDQATVTVGDSTRAVTLRR